MADSYLFLKSVHILGVILFLGNIIVTGWWKVMADKTGDARVVSFAQRQVTLTDYVFTALGVILVILAGETMVQHFYAGGPPSITWVHYGRGFFIASGVIWITILVPVQIKQARMAKTFAESGVIPEQYWRLGRIWNVFGLIATVLPLINIYWMVYKPVW